MFLRDESTGYIYIQSDEYVGLLTKYPLQDQLNNRTIIYASESIVVAWSRNK